MLLSACARQAVVPASSTHPAVGKPNASLKTFLANMIKRRVNFIVKANCSCVELNGNGRREIWACCFGGMAEIWYLVKSATFDAFS